MPSDAIPDKCVFAERAKQMWKVWQLSWKVIKVESRRETQKSYIFFNKKLLNIFRHFQKNLTPQVQICFLGRYVGTFIFIYFVFFDFAILRIGFIYWDTKQPLYDCLIVNITIYWLTSRNLHNLQRNMGFKVILNSRIHQVYISLSYFT